MQQTPESAEEMAVALAEIIETSTLADHDGLAGTVSNGRSTLVVFENGRRFEITVREA